MHKVLKILSNKIEESNYEQVDSIIHSPLNKITTSIGDFKNINYRISGVFGVSQNLPKWGKSETFLIWPVIFCYLKSSLKKMILDIIFVYSIISNLKMWQRKRKLYQRKNYRIQGMSRQEIIRDDSCSSDITHFLIATDMINKYV